MLDFDAAITLLQESVSVLSSETLALENAAGRFLAEDVLARNNAPRNDVSSMDGYAVARNTTRPDEWQAIVGEARPGKPFLEKVGPGEAVRIFTGGELPRGADTIIMQEYALREGDRVLFREDFGPAVHVRTAGSDFCCGDILLSAGERLSPQAMIATAAADHSRVRVSRQPQVAIIATGNELEAPGQAFTKENALPESASFGVSALSERMGARTTLRIRGRDELAELSELAARALEVSDCVVVIGGASVGDYDFARPMFTELGMRLVFSKVAIRPGKPVWLGKVGEKSVLGLPGNPTSALVTARLFLQPLLAAMQGGHPSRELAFTTIQLAGELPATGDRTTFARARSTPEGLVPPENQESGAQSPLALSNWLIRRPARSPAAKSGMVVEAMPI